MDSAAADHTDTLGQIVKDQIDRLSNALWVYDFDHKRVVWANTAALDVWAADSRAELYARDLSEGMSSCVAERLNQYKIDLVDPKREAKEIWTLYPRGVAQTLDVTYRGVTLPDGRIALLCDGTRDQQREPEALRSAEALLHTPVMITLLLPDGTPVYQNPAARAARIDPEMRLRDWFVDFYEAEDFFAGMQRHDLMQTVTRLHTSNGERWHELNVRRCLDAVTGATAYLVSEIDVTSLKEAEERAGAADRAKSEFLANMSHEIRTPMNGVLGMADLLAMTDLNSRQAEFVDIIVKSGSSLLSVLNDVLDYSKLTAGKMTLDEDAVDLQDLAGEVASLMSAQVHQKGIELNVRIAPHVPAMLRGDAGRLRQVLLNLVGNAVKFTDQGSILLNVDGSGDSVNGQFDLKIEVHDTGPGIPEDKLTYIFDQFAQIDGSTTRSHDGTGLGLSICASLVTLMGGRIGAESEVGKGTCFRVELGLPIDQSGHSALNATTDVTKGARVLIVEDSAVSRDILTEALTAWGCIPHHSSTGVDALSQLRDGEDGYDCILLNQTLPVMRGSDVVAVMRADRRLKNIPVIMLRTVDLSGAEAMNEAIQVDAHLVKPIRMSILKGKLVEILQDSKMMAASHDADGDSGDSDAASPEDVGTECLDVLICEDNILNQKYVSELMTFTDYRYEIASNGHEAVALFKEHKPKLVLMDISMPGMNGEEATAEIRKLEAGRARTPIIAFSAHVMPEDIARFKESGMDDHLAKPVSLNDLLEKLRLWMAHVNRANLKIA